MAHVRPLFVLTRADSLTEIPSLEMPPATTQVEPRTSALPRSATLAVALSPLRTFHSSTLTTLPDAAVTSDSVDAPSLPETSRGILALHVAADAEPTPIIASPMANAATALPRRARRPPRPNRRIADSLLGRPIRPGRRGRTRGSPHDVP